MRYLGEGHVIEGIANQKDMWQRILAWFDEFLVDDSNDEKKPGAVRH